MQYSGLCVVCVAQRSIGMSKRGTKNTPQLARDFEKKRFPLQLLVGVAGLMDLTTVEQIIYA